MSGAPGMVLPGYHATNLAMHAYPYMLAGQYMMPQVCPLVCLSCLSIVGDFPYVTGHVIMITSSLVAITSGWF